MSEKVSKVSRRSFLENSAKAAISTIALSGFPSIVPASVFHCSLGIQSPSQKNPLVKRQAHF